MKHSVILFLLFISQSLSLSAQYIIKGTVQDSGGQPLTGAIVRLNFGNDSIGVSADMNGKFAFNSAKSSQFTLSAAFIGFTKVVKAYKLDSLKKEHVLPIIKMAEASNNLQDVIITAVVPVKVKEDTTEFNALAYPVREGDAVEEIIKKLPGVEVDKDGNVTSQGKAITKIRVNGKDFFGTDVATAIQNLPADIIKNLQLIDDYGDQANLTGIKDGEPEKILNINIQEDKKRGYFARGTGGMGNEDRYIASLRGNHFKGDRQISLDASLNNTNSRGGGGDGITNRKGLYLNYRNEWNKTLSANGSYSFNNNENNTIGRTYSQTIYDSYSLFADENNNNTSINDRHNLRGNVEYKPDTNNFIKLSPSFNYSNSESENFGFTNTLQQKYTSLRNNQSFRNSMSLNVGTDLMFNHRFSKKGRNFNLWSTINYSNGDNGQSLLNDYVNTDSTGQVSTINQNQAINNFNDTFRAGFNTSYTEPIWKNSYLQLSYNWNRSANSANRGTRNIDARTGEEAPDPTLSNDYKYTFTTQRFGLNYRFIKPKYNYSFGVSAQPSLLDGEDLTRNNLSTRQYNVNVIPTARFVYNFTKQKSLRANYNGRASQPNFNQLQPISDNSNLQNTIKGNPDLQPEFTHGLNLEYNQSDWNEGYTLFSNLSYNQTENKIVTTRESVLDEVNNRIYQMTSYTNTDGFYNMRGNYTLSKPFADRKYTITLNGGSSYSNNIAFANGLRNIGKNLLFEQGLRFRLDLKDVIDTELKTSYSINKTDYSVESYSDRKTNRLMFGLEGRNYFFKDLTLGYDFSKNLNSGFVNSTNANPMILNLSMEYRFLKGNMASLRIQGYDLFNENTGISRDVFDNEIIDRQTNRLGRYFLMSFNLRIRKFGI